VACAAEVGMVGISDEEQLSFATEAGRKFVTQDADFLRLRSRLFLRLA